MPRCFLLLLAAFLLPTGALAEDKAASLQSDGRGVRASDRTVDIQNLALDLEVDIKGRSVRGTATHTLSPLRSGLMEFRLHAVALNVSSVVLDGQETTFRTVPTQLIVALPSPSVAGATHTVVISYSATPQLGLHFRAPGANSPDTYNEVWSQGEDSDNRHWFPTWDEPDDRFTYSGTFTVPSRFTAVSNGRLMSKAAATAKPGWTTWTYALSEQDLVSYLVMFAAAEYRVLSERWRNRPVLAYLPPDVDDATGRRAVGRTTEMLDFMSEVTGVEYPYPGYSHVFVQRFLYTGMENTTATVMERNTLFPAELAAHSQWTESVVAHELAHQWFGDQLTTRDWSHMWLNEGITTFLEGWWWRHAHGPEEWADKVFGRVARVVSADERSPRPMVVDFFTREGSRKNSNVYTKGSAVMNGLRAMVGEEDFGRAFRAYVAENQHAMVTTRDLQRSFEDTLGLDLSWYFQQWAYLAGHPVLSVKHAWDAEQRVVRIDLAQTQEVSGNVPLFVLPVDLEIGTTSGVERRRVWLEGATASLVLSLPEAPKWIGVDPDGGLMAKVEQEQTDDEWAATLTGATSPYAKRLAWAAVGGREKPPGPVLRAAVTGVLMDGEAHPTWRRLAVEALGSWKDEVSAQTLVDALGRLGGFNSGGVPGIEQDTRLQHKLAERLGNQEHSEPVIAALKTLHQRGGNVVVTTRALRSLGKVSKTDGLIRARADLGKPGGHLDERWRGAIDLLGSDGERKDLDRLEALRDPSAAHRTRSAALRASARIANREPVGKKRDAARAVVARDAERSLDDLHLRGVQTAVGVLGSIGDKRSVTALQSARSACTVEVLRDAMTRAIESIRTRKESDPDPETNGEMTAQLKKLQEQLDELEKQMKDMQERR